jgi:hypothetical protein
MMASDETVELVIKLRDGLKSAEYESVRSTLRDVGVQLREDAPTEFSFALENYSSVIVPRGVASRAVEALKGNAAVEGAFVKPRGETP